MGEIVDATGESFHEQVGHGHVLVDVWGPRCRPCLALLPHLEQIAAERADLRVLKLEAPRARRLCMELGVRGLPSFLLFREGQEVARISEPDLGAARLRQWLSEELDDHDSSGEEVTETCS